MKIVVLSTGAPHHAKRFVEMVNPLTKHELDYPETPFSKDWHTWHPSVKWDFIDFRKYDAVLTIGTFGVTGPELVSIKSRWPHLKIISCWIGTDILWFQNDPKYKEMLPALDKVTDRHICDHYPFADELAEMGITARPFRFGTPYATELKPVPLPEIPTVMSYIPHGMEDKYRLDWVLKAAEECAEVKFRILARRDSDTIETSDNVTFVPYESERAGYLRELGKASMVVRVPPHDGVGISYIEAKCMGRWGINSQRLPFSEYAPTLETLIESIIRMSGKTDPDTVGAGWYSDVYSPANTAAEFDKAIRGIE